jgi:hypothetical protein
MSATQSRRKRGRTTIHVPGVRVCEDLVDRAFMAAAPDRDQARQAGLAHEPLDALASDALAVGHD